MVFDFAHSNLFIAYREALLAQDELQVLEHPFLGSIRECMVNKGKGSKENIKFLSEYLHIQHHVCLQMCQDSA